MWSDVSNIHVAKFVPRLPWREGIKLTTVYCGNEKSYVLRPHWYHHDQMDKSLLIFHMYTWIYKWSISSYFFFRISIFSAGVPKIQFFPTFYYLPNISERHYQNLFVFFNLPLNFPLNFLLSICGCDKYNNSF